MKLDLSPVRSTVQPIVERRDFGGSRDLGRLVALNGMEGTIAFRTSPGEVGEHWSVGHLITIVHQKSRLVGVVCELATADRLWSESEGNITYIGIEFSGEIVDDDFGAPVFYRGIRSYPALGAIAHRIRADDLRAIYSFRGVQAVEIGRLTQNEAVPASVSIDELVTPPFRGDRLDRRRQDDRGVDAGQEVPRQPSQTARADHRSAQRICAQLSRHSRSP